MPPKSKSGGKAPKLQNQPPRGSKDGQDESWTSGMMDSTKENLKDGQLKGNLTKRVPSASTLSRPNISLGKPPSSGGNDSTAVTSSSSDDDDDNPRKGDSEIVEMIKPLRKPRNPWAISLTTLSLSLLGLGLLWLMVESMLNRQLDAKGCRMAYMWPSYNKLDRFDAQHTRFAGKYSLYLYREQYIDDQHQVLGTPVLFIPGNAGSHKQVRSLGSESANYFNDFVQHDGEALARGAKRLDFFAADFNEDFTAFHGPTVYEQAEYANEAIKFILSLYEDLGRDVKPTSVIIVGHSMGGIVARTMLTMPNYVSNSINTILTMSTPHALAPVTFDWDMTQLYRDLTGYWRASYAQPDDSNPLSQVTLVSIAGGGLDFIVPSDYASVESLVPSTHGFTVFTSTIPTVWTSTDHLSILWCDQLRKVIVRSLYDIVDANHASQTKPYTERMRAFRKRFLTGMEDDAERMAPSKQANTLLTVHGRFDAVTGPRDILSFRKLGATGKVQARLMPIPEVGSLHNKQFTLLTDQELSKDGDAGCLQVLLCSKIPAEQGPREIMAPFSVDIPAEPSGEDHEPTQLACTNAALDAIQLPASTSSTQYPFWRDGEPETPMFSYLQYNLEDLYGHQFVAVIDTGKATSGFAIAEFRVPSLKAVDIDFWDLLWGGFTTRLPLNRMLVTEFRIPSVQSSLLAYNLDVESYTCNKPELFAPILRQHISAPYESKFHVNVNHTSINMHGVAPYMPEPVEGFSASHGLTLQFWTDPRCGSEISVSLKVDWRGSVGKLWMRYRTIFASFPLMIVALVYYEQFRVYEEDTVFISFSEALDESLFSTTGLPVVLLLFSAQLFVAGHSQCRGPCIPILPRSLYLILTQSLVGTLDRWFIFLVPLFGIICFGLCIVLNYVVLLLTALIRPIVCLGGLRQPSTVGLPTPVRISFWAAFLVLVLQAIPFQVAYLILCLVQLATTARASSLSDLSPTRRNFYNYTHSVLILMIWVLPVNIPVVVVFIRNLTIGWPTTFSWAYNALAIAPFAVIVDLIMMGNMPHFLIEGWPKEARMVTPVVALLVGLFGFAHGYALHILAEVLVVGMIVRTFASPCAMQLTSPLVEDQSQAKRPDKK